MIGRRRVSAEVGDKCSGSGSVAVHWRGRTGALREQVQLHAISVVRVVVVEHWIQAT